MHIRGPVTGVEAGCEQVLRTLPGWFGIEHSLLAHARATARLPTFVAEADGCIVGFLSLQEQLPQSWEVNCIAVHAAVRQRGIGRQLQRAAEAWLQRQRAQQLQVTTLSASHPSPEYAETREFYEAVGYLPQEESPTCGLEHLPLQQFVKLLQQLS